MRLQLSDTIQPVHSTPGTAKAPQEATWQWRVTCGRTVFVGYFKFDVIIVVHVRGSSFL
jgi:hypothetical protein